ncbi:hypothetical protein [Helicobacter winghamensis]|uniref:hypothetical protein n=1 Tax=Helicobacter winghamensis TaxID=157268 RepID=UPI00351B703A
MRMHTGLMDSKKIRSQIQLSLENWDFSALENYYRLSIGSGDENYMDYIVYLHQTGQLGKIKTIFENHENQPYWWVDKKININYEEFLKILNKNEITLSDVSNGCLACFKLNSAIQIGEVDVELFCKDLLHNYRHKMGIISKKYYVHKLIDLAMSGNKISKHKNFDEEKQTKDYLYFANLLTVLLNDFDQDFGCKIYQEKLRHILKLFLFNDDKINTNNRVAICISGASRGDWLSGLKDVIKTFSKLLHFDCFVFTWEEVIEWPALCGGGHWVKRLLDPAFEIIADDEIKKDVLFKKYFPNTYYALNAEIYSQKKVSAAELDSIDEIKSYAIEKTGEFISKYGKVVNNSKLNYGIYRAFSLMEEYERQMGLKYDFVIRVRPDAKYVSSLNLEELHKLSHNEIALNYFEYQSGTPKDFAVYGRRNAMEIYSKIWEASFLNKKFDFFCKTPIVLHNHHVARNWILLNDLQIVRSKIIEKLTGESLVSSGYIMPDISEKLFSDLLNLKGVFEDKKLEHIQLFFSKVAEKYGRKSIRKAKLKDSIYFSAKSRIQNQLAYKLGQEMIFNSKSLGGYIRMPFVLWNTAQKHKQQQKDYLEKVKKNPSLKLPPLESYLDYKEALKCKDHLSYKLGEALIRADNNRWGGGYIRLLFEIRKLKKVMTR